jgi:hypothetical protein
MTPILLTALRQAAEPRMDTASWLFLALAWVAVASLTVWCFLRVLRGPPPS